MFGGQFVWTFEGVMTAVVVGLLVFAWLMIAVLALLGWVSSKIRIMLCKMGRHKYSEYKHVCMQHSIRPDYVKANCPCETVIECRYCTSRKK